MAILIARVAVFNIVYGETHRLSQYDMSNTKVYFDICETHADIVLIPANIFMDNDNH